VAGPIATMSYYVYIIYSDLIQRHYIGSSEDLNRRLEAHNSGLSTYTSKASDWRVIYQVTLPTKSEALVLEKKIKKRGAKRYLEDLKISGRSAAR
jgi:putative endonuclease